MNLCADADCDSVAKEVITPVTTRIVVANKRNVTVVALEFFFFYYCC